MEQPWESDPHAVERGERRRNDRRERQRRRELRRRRMLLGSLGVLVVAAIVGTVVAIAQGGGGTAEEPGSVEVSALRFSLADLSGLDRISTQTALLDAQRRVDYVSRGGDKRRVVALTFDDGPSPYTTKILRTLQHNKVPATFFQLGVEVEQYPKIARRVARSQWAEVGNHTYDHPRLDRLPSADAENELIRGAQSIINAGADIPRLFRPPYGGFNTSVIASAHRIGEMPVLWSVDSRDYTGLPAKAIAARVLDAVEPGSIVLMHDGGGNRSQTAAALPTIIRQLKKRKYKLVTVAEMLVNNPPPSKQATPTANDHG